MFRRNPESAYDGAAVRCADEHRRGQFGIHGWLTAAGGFLGHLTAGHADWPVALALVPGIFIAGQIGARKAVKTDKRKMKVYFGYFLFGLAVFLALRATYGGI